MGFQDEKSGYLETLEAIFETESSIGITVDGHPVREPLGPTGLPFVGSFYEIYPDHLGNHARLFAKFGPVIKTVSDYNGLI